MNAEARVARTLLQSCVTREQAQRALRLMAEHYATPAEIADAALEWDQLHASGVHTVYTEAAS